jgi:flagellar basal-body rod modification protein FlgD
MLGVKGGTQTYSKAEQVSSLRGDGKQTVSATNRDAALNGKEDIGEVLNKVADPNWVDPKKMRQVGGNELDKDAFLKLFLAQLKNQDPTNTMDSHELAAQLAQFSSLEKLNSIDEGIGSLAQKGKNPQNFEVLSMVGRTVMGDSAKIIRTDAKASHEIGFNLQGEADVAEVSIRNAAGQEIRKLEIRGLKKGPNKLDWDGRLDNGTNANEGDYSVIITAKNAAGQKVHAETKFKGRVTGVNFTGQGPILMMGQQAIKLTDVKGISDPTLEGNENILDGANKITKTKSLMARDASEPDMTVVGMGGNLESVGMQQGLINNIEKSLNKPTNKGVKE